MYEPPIMEDFRTMQMFGVLPSGWYKEDLGNRALMIGYRRQKMRNEAYVGDQLRITS